MRRFALALIVVAAGGTLPVLAPAQAQDAPILGREVPRGQGIRTTAPPQPANARRTLDGKIADWVGSATRIGGTLVADRGELIYQDHIFDAWGADDGRDARRLMVSDPLADGVPETFRLDSTQQANLPGEFGLPVPADLQVLNHYGDLPRQDSSDLLELRMAASAQDLWVLARTTTLRPEDRTALLILADTQPGDQERDVPFASGLRTTKAEVALLLTGNGGWVADLAAGGDPSLPGGRVATNPDGYVNAIEARIPRRLLSPGGAVNPGEVRLAAATGPWDPSGGFADHGLPTRVANVAYRTAEPVRQWFEKQQALSLHLRSVDRFFADVPLDALAAGATERFTPGPGYHDRIFTSTERISVEKALDGLHQHYGLYLPKSYRQGEASPMQMWMHWRGGEAHTGAMLAPRIFKHLGEDQDSVMVAPRGRGTAKWYMGKSHMDVLEVWKDALESVSIDRDQVYVAGHSMGGWGSYLLSVLYPDRFAATMPVAGVVSFGGADTRKLIDNERGVGVGILHGAEDQLVPVTGPTQQAARLTELGYRHRYYLFPTYEHYSHPINDEWAEGARYLHTFRRDPNPPRVTYIRDMSFERVVETYASDDVPFDFNFDSAYWMSGLTPADGEKGVAKFDGRTLAGGAADPLVLPEVGGPAAPGQTGPYTMTGLRWADDPLAGKPEASNAFTANLSGARAVQLDLERMRVDSNRTVRGTVASEHALDLRLAGRWSARPTVTVDGRPAPASFDRAGVLGVQLPAGRSELVIEPSPVGVTGPREKGGCVSPRAAKHRFRVTMRTRRGRGASRLRRSRVRHVSFRLDGRRAGSDRRRPFVVRVNRRLKPGRHVLTARVLLRVPGGGKTFRRKLVYRFRVCSG